jgi:hypothetical protein
MAEEKRRVTVPKTGHRRSNERYETNKGAGHAYVGYDTLGMTRGLSRDNLFL